MSLIGKLGRVKCTYAELFNSRGEKVFSIQKKDAKDMPIAMAVGEVQKGYVPCLLTDDCKELISKKLAKSATGGKTITLKKYQRIFKETCYVKQVAVSGFEYEDVIVNKKSIPWWMIAAGALVVRKLLK